ncbi:MAG: hypothetical protein V3U52_05290 [Thermoplasmata archaeon]
MKFLTDRQVEVLERRLNGERVDSRVWNYLKGRLPDLLEGIVEEMAQQTRAMEAWEEPQLRREAAQAEKERLLEELGRLPGPSLLFRWLERPEEVWGDLMMARARGQVPLGRRLTERLVVHHLEGLPPGRRRSLLDELEFRAWPDPPPRIVSHAGLPADLGDMGRAFLRGHGGRLLRDWTVLEAVGEDPRKAELQQRAPKAGRAALGELLDRFQGNGLVEFHEHKGESPGRPPIHVRLTERGRRLLRRFSRVQLAD